MTQAGNQPDIALDIENLYKDFMLHHEQKNSLKESVLHFGKSTYEKQHVLKDINLQVKRGEFFGIVGRNGSGKSTLLKIIGGIYQPTKGRVQVNGTLTPFIELGIGFSPNLTGRENVFLNGAILGLSRREVNKLYPKIVDFAELHQFMDQKLKNYSSGMQVRLAFSIAIQAHNDILLIDEVLAVGDANFQRKCFDVFKEVKRSGKTVIFVSHDMGAVQEYCDRAMLIDNGNIVALGKSGEVARRYNELNLEEAEKSLQNKNSEKEVTHQTNTAASITEIRTELQSKPRGTFSPKDSIEVLVKVTAKQTIEHPVIGITIKTIDGLPVFATNTKVKKVKTMSLEAGQTMAVRFKLDNTFNDGSYLISPAVANEDAKVFYDWLDDACTFRVGGWDMPFGLIQTKHTIDAHVEK